MIVGDALANLRDALDHIAWALAQRHIADNALTLTDRQERSITFPLRTTPLSQNLVIGGLNHSDVEFFPPAAYGTIEQFQPYNRTNRSELELLGILAELSNADKHRIITPTLVEAGVVLSPIPFSAVRMRLDKPHESRWIGRGDAFEPQAAYVVILDTAMRPPPLDNGFDVLEFDALHQLIRDEVIPAFAGFFT